MVARTRLNVKLLHTLPVWLSHHYAYSAFLANQFTAQNNIYRMSQEEWTKLRESVPYVEL